MSINTKAQNDKENILEDKGYASVKDWEESEGIGEPTKVQEIEVEGMKEHWCSRIQNDEDYEDSKLAEHQPYYAGDLTQK
jgi:hypothetical protein